MKFKRYSKKLLGIDEIYTIAYRRTRQSLVDQTNHKIKFNVIPSNKKYWYADPILFEKCLFMEVYNRKKNKGCIGVSQFNYDGSLQEPAIIIEEAFHMSFPIVFRINGELFMLPETGSVNKLIFYKCIDYPYKWTKFSVIDTSDKFTDSIIIEHNHKFYVISSILDQKHPNRTRQVFFELLYGNKRFILKEINFQNKNVSNKYRYDVRNAGYLFQYRGKTYRPSQISSEAEYGLALKFNQVIYFGKDHFTEKSVGTIDITNIDTNRGKRFKRRMLGVHTYMFDGDLEVIDIKFADYRPFFIFHILKNKCIRFISVILKRRN